MRAIVVDRFGPPEVMALRTLTDPAPPAPGQVLVRLRAVGVNPVEAYIRAGTYASLPSLPYVPGSDAAGTVEAVGAGLDAVAPGARVYTTATAGGAYAELALCSAGDVHALPDDLSFAHGAALGVPYATACRALFQRGRLAAGDTVLVHGASGGVGLAAVQLASAAGATVTGTAGSDEGRNVVLAQGAVAVVDHGAGDAREELRSLTGGRGFDLIVEMLANVNLGDDLTLLAPRGRVVVVGSRGQVTIDPRDLMERDGDVLAMRLPNASTEERAAIDATIGAGLAAGIIRPVIAETLPLDQAAEAHRLVMGAAHRGKVVLEP